MQRPCPCGSRSGSQPRGAALKEDADRRAPRVVVTVNADTPDGPVMVYVTATVTAGIVTSSEQPAVWQLGFGLVRTTVVGSTFTLPTARTVSAPVVRVTVPRITEVSVLALSAMVSVSYTHLRAH